MKSVLTGICLMIAIGLIAWLVTGTQETTSGESHVSTNNSVRLDN